MFYVAKNKGADQLGSLSLNVFAYAKICFSLVSIYMYVKFQKIIHDCV